MRRPILPTVALVLVLASPAGAAEKVSERDRFELWNGCRPMDLVVETLPKAATDIGLTREAVTVAARSRLRAARPYDDDALESLWINVNAAGPAHGILVGYFKWVRDEASDISWSAMTGFIDEYLRVNADVCRNSN